MGPLNGIRVLEISDTQAGCVAGMLLADYGAAVIRIDTPGNSASRATPGFLVWNRGKQSVSLDLNQSQGREVLRWLLEQIDVLIETLEPGQSERWGLDYTTTLQHRFPRLVHCSITGYDEDGPDRNRPGYDGLVQARAGMMLSGPMSNGIPPSWAQGGHRPGPKYMGFPAPSYAAAFFGTLGILTALVVRKQTGRGQHVNSSLHAGIMAMTRRARAQNAAGPSMGSGRGLGGIWQCGDGEWVWTHTGARGSFDRYMKIFGLEQYMAAAPNPIPWGPEVTQELRSKVAAILKTKPRAEWIRLFDENDCPNAAALRPGRAFDDEQANVAGMVAAVNDPEFGALQEVGVPIEFSLTPGEIRGSAPRPGEHTVPILRDLGIAEAEVARLRSGGVVQRRVEWEEKTAMKYPLEGIKILDFGVYLAGPFAGRLLGDLGASVIKVESPEGEVPRPKNDQFIPNMLMTYSNRGRNIAVDLKHPEGLRVAHKLIAEADIVSQNQRLGVAERLGIGYEDCRAINPDIIYLASPGYGTHGPRAHLTSFEPLNSAFVGQHYRSGGEGNPPVGSISLDAFCGLIGANGLLMALLHREETGQGQCLVVSQLACAMYYTSDTFRTSDGTLGPLPQLDREQRGLGPLNRLYQTSDDWICICCEKDQEWSALCGALGRPELAHDARFRTAEDRTANGEALGAMLDDVFRDRTAQEWAGALDRHGAPCEIPVAGGMPGLENPDYLAYGLITEYRHPIWGRTVEPRIIPVLSQTPGRSVSKSPFLGEHTREIMEELGYGRAEIDELVRQRVVVARHQEMAVASS